MGLATATYTVTSIPSGPSRQLESPSRFKSQLKEHGVHIRGIRERDRNETIAAARPVSDVQSGTHSARGTVKDMHVHVQLVSVRYENSLSMKQIYIIAILRV